MSSFAFKKFIIQQDRTAMKVTTDACLFGAVVAAHGCITANTEVLDIGTGTGLLSLMLAQQHAEARFEAIELDADAAKQAAINVAHSPWSQRITVVSGDAMHYSFPRLYPFIIANPPFYENQLQGPLGKKNLAHHDTGLTLHNLIVLLHKLLQTNGEAWLLLPAYRKQALINEASLYGFVAANIIDIYPRPGKASMRMIVRLCRKEQRAHPISNLPTRITVYDAANQYDALFVHYLQAYYLYL